MSLRSSARIASHAIRQKAFPGFSAPIDFANPAIAIDARGRTYRRLVLERSMPPRSAETLFDNFEPMPEADRAMVTEWLLGGAPE